MTAHRRTTPASLTLFALLALACAALTACKKDAPAASSGDPSAAPSPDAPKAAPSHAPPMTPDKVPPGLDAFPLGKATEADMIALLGMPGEREADTALGGTMTVLYNNQPAIKLSWSSEAAVRRKARAQDLPPAATDDAVRQLLQRLPTTGAFADFESINATFTRATPDAPPTLLSLYARASDQAKPAHLCAFIEQKLGQDPESTRCPGTNRRFGKTQSGLSYCAGDPDGAHNVFIECFLGEQNNAGTVSLEMTLAR